MRKKKPARIYNTGLFPGLYPQEAEYYSSVVEKGLDIFRRCAGVRIDNKTINPETCENYPRIGKDTCFACSTQHCKTCGSIVVLGPASFDMICKTCNNRLR